MKKVNCLPQAAQRPCCSYETGIPLFGRPGLGAFDHLRDRFSRFIWDELYIWVFSRENPEQFVSKGLTDFSDAFKVKYDCTESLKALI